VSTQTPGAEYKPNEFYERLIFLLSRHKYDVRSEKEKRDGGES